MHPLHVTIVIKICVIEKFTLLAIWFRKVLIQDKKIVYDTFDEV